MFQWFESVFKQYSQTYSCNFRCCLHYITFSSSSSSSSSLSSSSSSINCFYNNAALHSVLIWMYLYLQYMHTLMLGSSCFSLQQLFSSQPIWTEQYLEPAGATDKTFQGMNSPISPPEMWLVCFYCCKHGDDYYMSPGRERIFIYRTVSTACPPLLCQVNSVISLLWMEIDLSLLPLFVFDTKQYRAPAKCN